MTHVGEQRDCKGSNRLQREFRTSNVPAYLALVYLMFVHQISFHLCCQESIFSIFVSQSKAIKDAVKYYSACLNTKSIEKRYDQPLKSLIRNYGSWPVTDKNFSVSNWNWSDSFMKTHKFLALTPIFNMYVSDDLKNSSNNVIVVSCNFLVSYYF